MCQFEHNDDKDNGDNLDETEDDESYGENDCHLCVKTFSNLDELCVHLKQEHEDYHEKIRLEAEKYRMEANKHK